MMIKSFLIWNNLIYIIVVLSLLLLLTMVILLYVFKFKRGENNEEDKYFISKDRIEMIKEKYKSLEKIKKMKKVTKEDVENFYKSQSDNN